MVEDGVDHLSASLPKFEKNPFHPGKTTPSLTPHRKKGQGREDTSTEDVPGQQAGA